MSSVPLFSFFLLLLYHRIKTKVSDMESKSESGKQQKAFFGHKKGKTTSEHEKKIMNT